MLPLLAKFISFNSWVILDLKDNFLHSILARYNKKDAVEEWFRSIIKNWPQGIIHQISYVVGMMSKGLYTVANRRAK